MALLTGDSVAVGLAAYIHHVKVDARSGRRTGEGVAHIRKYPDDTLYVSLGGQDSQSFNGVRLFRKRAKLVVGGRKCVAWITIPERPKLNRVLQALPHIHVISDDGLKKPLSREEYLVLANRMTNACPEPKTGRSTLPSIAPPLPEFIPGIPGAELPKLPILPLPL